MTASFLVFFLSITIPIYVFNRGSNQKKYRGRIYSHTKIPSLAWQLLWHQDACLFRFNEGSYVIGGQLLNKVIVLTITSTGYLHSIVQI